MSDRSAADDFFGIEYMSSQSPKPEIKEEQAVKDHAKPKKSFRLRTDVTDLGKDVSQLSGTEFLDRAFFPQLELDPDSSERDDSKLSKDFIEEQFFRRMGSPDGRMSGAPVESEESTPQMVELDQNKESRRRSHVNSSQRRRKNVSPEKSLRQKDSSAQDENDEFDGSSDGTIEESGLQKIRADIIPLWRMTQEELLDLMSERILYKDENILALDKPYGMAYSGSSPTAPHNAMLQSTLKEDFEKGLVEQISRCIVRGELDDSPVKINIPLLKTVKDRDMKLVPLVSNKAKGEIFYVESECRTVRGKSICFKCGKIPHQIRAHLALAGCPLIGDAKYSGSSPRTPRLSHHVLDSLNVTDSQSRKIPMYLHSKEVTLPAVSRSNAPIRIHAPLPAHFKWMLRKLKLVKR
ncbi:hypothetical protein OSTOST_12691 [Ostertagia ostertagi]